MIFSKDHKQFMRWASKTHDPRAAKMGLARLAADFGTRIVREPIQPGEFVKLDVSAR